MTEHEMRARATGAVIVMLAEAGLIDTKITTPSLMSLRIGLSADDVVAAQEHLITEGILSDRLDGRIEWRPAHQRRIKQLTLDADAA